MYQTLFGSKFCYSNFNPLTFPIFKMTAIESTEPSSTLAVSNWVVNWVFYNCDSDLSLGCHYHWLKGQERPILSIIGNCSDQLANIGWPLETCQPTPRIPAGEDWRRSVWLLFHKPVKTTLSVDKQYLMSSCWSSKYALSSKKQSSLKYCVKRKGFKCSMICSFPEFSCIH